jgi:cell division protein ZapA
MSNSLKIKILDKEYQVACKPEDRPALERSAELLNSKMQEVRRGGAIIGLDRIAVMTALNLAYELLDSQQTGNAADSELLEGIESRIDKALARFS